MMSSRILARSKFLGMRSGVRAFSMKGPVFQEATPNINSKSNNKEVQGQAETFKYNPKVFSERKGNGAGPILPINVEALYHEPLKHEIKHGYLAGELHLRSYGIQNLDFFVDFALRAAYYLGIPVSGPGYLPTQKQTWTVIKAPFVHAKSKENFERKTHKRLLKAWDTNPETLDLWLSVLNKYSITGVGIKANVFVRESLSALKELDSVNFDIDDSNPYLKSEAVNSDLVSQRVSELLKDPIFKKHLEPKVEEVKSS